MHGDSAFEGYAAKFVRLAFRWTHGVIPVLKVNETGVPVIAKRCRTAGRTISARSRLPQEANERPIDASQCAAAKHEPC